MKLTLSLIIFFFIQGLSAQTFTEVIPDFSFEGVGSGSVAFSDIDGDGDKDVLIMGVNISQELIAKLYTNEGGRFTEVPDTPFEGLTLGSIAFSDIDGDGDEDVLMTGQNNSLEPVTKLYTNDGGNFYEISGTPFENVRYSAIAFSDVDGDGDNDVLITGENSFQEPIAKLYTNDGGSFFEANGTTFESVAFGTVDFLDVDGDGDDDLLLTGQKSLIDRFAKLYMNNGGTFTEVSGTPFDGVGHSSVAFSDVDGDLDNDLLITGYNGSGKRTAKLYLNEVGNYTEVTDTPFYGVASGSVDFSDVDGDGDQDVLITGQKETGERTAILFTNEGGSFTEVTHNPFSGVSNSSAAFSDVDNDGDTDLIIIGSKYANIPTAYLYENDGGYFRVITDMPFDGVAYGSVAFSDVDGDGDNDLLITGGDNLLKSSAKLYLNDGGYFTKILSTPFEGVIFSAIAFSDVDGDGDDDVLITGRNNSGVRIAKLYTNNGGNFTEVLGTPFEGVEFGSVTFSDVDGDGDNDVLITGRNNDPWVETAKLYKNNGNNFFELMGTPVSGVDHSSAAFSDVDGDGDNDVLITGENGSTGRTTKLYKNSGGNFTEVLSTPFDNVGYSSVAFSDVDGDSDYDVIIAGKHLTTVRIAKLYRNNGGSFTEVLNTPFIGVEVGSVAFSDVDSDGDNDVIISGRHSSGNRIAKLYTNDGASFTEVLGTPFEDVEDSSIAFSDVDGDGDEDLLITGRNDLGIRIAKLYRNDSVISSIKDTDDINSFDLVLYPNPTKANSLNISFDSKTIGLVTIIISDLNGRLLKKLQIASESGQQIISIDIASLAKGSYIIQLKNGRRISKAMFVIQ